MSEIKKLVVTNIASGEVEIDDFVDQPDMSAAMNFNLRIATDWVEYAIKTDRDVINFSDPVGTVVTTEKYKYEIKAAELGDDVDIDEVMSDQFDARIVKALEAFHGGDEE